MKVILFGGNGMGGQAALRECRRDPAVIDVLAVVRKPAGLVSAKVRELVHEDFLDFSSRADALTGHDTCLWCLGVSSAGLTEPDYARVTRDFTLAAARVLSARNPGMTFIFVSGAGTD